MPSTPVWRRYLRFWGPDVEADIDDELRFHLDHLIAEYEARGLPPAEAERTAAERFGNAGEIVQLLRSHDHQREQRRQRTDRVRDFRRQLRIAVRSLRRTPGFSLTAILTLALGIGFSTAVFAVAHTLLLEPLPVRDEARLVVLRGRALDGTVPNYPLGLDEARTFVRSTHALERVAFFAYQGTLPQPVLEDDRIVRLLRAQVSGDFFAVLGANAFLGRMLRESDDATGADPVAVLSYDAWQHHYGSDPRVVGRRVRMYNTGITYTVVGVAVRGFAFPRQTEYWVSIASSTLPGQEQFVGVNLVGRLAPERTTDDVRDELSTFYARPDAPKGRPRIIAVVESLRTAILGDARPAVLAFAAAVALLLVITCINVATLLLVRGLTRVQEMAVRSALGARRRHLVWLLLMEGAVLAVLGGLLGVAVAAGGLKAFVAFAPDDLPRLNEIGLNGIALAAAVVVTGVALLAFAVAPALSQSEVEVQQVLRSGTRQSMGRRSRMATEALVAGQIALALIIISAATLITRSLINLERAHLAFEPAHLLVADLTLRQDEYTGVAKQTLLLDRLIPAIAAVPGVVAVSPVVSAPFSGAAGWDARPTAEGQAPDDAARNPMLNVDVVGPDYFHTLGMRVVNGRGFTASDREGAPLVVVVSRSAARHYWPTTDAIGRRFIIGSSKVQGFSVVGVVEDTRYRDLREPRASVYFPLHQSFFPFAPTTIVVRTVGQPETLVPTLRRVVESVAPGVTLARAEPFEQFMRAPLAHPRLNAFLLVVFAGAAVLLAAVGLFGVMAAMVRHRTREIGIRLALGARPRDVLAMILARGLGIAGVGAACGCLGAVVANRALDSMLYAVSPTDVLTLALVTVLLVVVAAAATAIPARVAMRVDPGIALRADV